MYCLRQFQASNSHGDLMQEPSDSTSCPAGASASTLVSQGPAHSSHLSTVSQSQDYDETKLSAIKSGDIDALLDGLSDPPPQPPAQPPLHPSNPPVAHGVPVQARNAPQPPFRAPDVPLADPSSRSTATAARAPPLASAALAGTCSHQGPDNATTARVMPVESAACASHPLSHVSTSAATSVGMSHGCQPSAAAGAALASHEIASMGVSSNAAGGGSAAAASWPAGPPPAWQTSLQLDGAGLTPDGSMSVDRLPAVVPSYLDDSTSGSFLNQSGAEADTSTTSSTDGFLALVTQLPGDYHRDDGFTLFYSDALTRIEEKVTMRRCAMVAGTAVWPEKEYQTRHMENLGRGGYANVEKVLYTPYGYPQPFLMAAKVCPVPVLRNRSLLRSMSLIASFPADACNSDT